MMTKEPSEGLAPLPLRPIDPSNAAEELVDAELLEGTVQPATIERIDGERVQVLLPGGGLGLAPASEFQAFLLNSPEAIGQRCEVFVEQRIPGPGPGPERFAVSKDKAERWRQLERVLKAHADGSVVEGEVTAAIEGGFAVDVGVKAFLPASLFGLRPAKDKDQIIGHRFRFKVLRVDEKRHNIVLSRRALFEEEQGRARDRIRPGAIVEGVVKNLVEYGAFVEVAGIDGLLHVSDMSYRMIKHPSEAVKIGERLTLKVLKFDPESGRLSLGLRQAQEDPWAKVGARFAVGVRVRGLVVSKTDYGFFLEIEPGLEGLVHTKGVGSSARDAAKRIEIGDEVEAEIIDVDAARKRLSLAIPAPAASA